MSKQSSLSCSGDLGNLHSHVCALMHQSVLTPKYVVLGNDLREVKVECMESRICVVQLKQIYGGVQKARLRI